ncbi:MAG TPA: hypothetical protein VK446_10980 [Methylocystis sp.]|nr:hypothetical protein [Methylocystis sp.]
MSCLLASPSAAGALLLPESEGQAIVTTTFADATKAYDSSGRTINAPPYNKFELRTYIEYGLTNEFTVVGEAGVTDFRSTYQDFPGAPPTVSQYRGIGVSALGGRVPLGALGDALFSLEASARAAPAEAAPYSDIRSRAQADVRLQMFKPLELWELPAFLDMQTGFRSSGQLGQEARVDVTLGLHARPDLMFLAQSFSVISPRTSGRSVAYAQKLELSAVYDFAPKFSLQFGVFGAPVGWNGPAERGAATALWWRF